jgi:hypothetical protein
LQGLAVDKDLEDWLTTTLLPVVYCGRSALPLIVVL